MLNFHTLKAQISGAKDSDRLRLQSNHQTQLMSGSFLGRQVSRLTSGTLTASRSAENKAVKEAVTQALRSKYGKAIADTTNPLTNSDKPLTARDVKQWIQAADDAVMHTLCQKLTAPRNPADTKYDANNFSCKQEFVVHLTEKYSDAAINQALKVVDMSPEKTWTSLDIQRLTDTAQALHLQPQITATTSNHARAYFGDTNQVGQAKFLGAGNNNAVSLAQWAHKSEVSDKVFKPLSSPDAHDLQEHGIVKKGDGNMLGRNVASAELAHALGMPNKITASYAGQQNGVQGIVMDKAQGTSIQTETLRITLPPSTPALNQNQINALKLELSKQNLEIASIEGKTIQLQILNTDAIKQANHAVIQTRLNQHNDGEPVNAHITLTASGEIQAGPDADQVMVKIVQSQLTKGLTFSALPIDRNGHITDGKLNLELNQMQWLDFLCGQADRNPGNIFIQYSSDGSISGITGIDQDLSFGEKVDAQFQGGQFQGMPNHIDKSTAEKIKNLCAKDLAQFEQMLAKNGLSPKEISQAKDRLKFANATILQWEASGSTSILGAASAQWSQINTEGYSQYFAGSAQTTNANLSNLQALMNPGLLSLKADLHAQKNIGQSLQNMCIACDTAHGMALAQSALEQLTAQELATVLTQASPAQIVTLAKLPNAHSQVITELQSRHQSDTQRFHATVQGFQAENLNVPTSLTNAADFAQTTVQLAETWASLQAYAEHPNTPIPPQTLAAHQLLQGYLQIQTQSTTLAAAELSDEQLGKLNLALKKLVPGAQRATVLQGFSDVFKSEFAARLMDQSLHAVGTWLTLLATPPEMASMQNIMDTIQTLNQQREIVIERAATMLMDGARNDATVQTILQAALSEALSQLPPQAAAAVQSRSWMQESIIDVLEQNAHLLTPMSDEEEAQIGHLMALLPGLVRAATSAAPDENVSDLRTTLYQAQQLNTKLFSNSSDGGLGALQDFLLSPQVNASILTHLDSAAKTKLETVFDTIRGENRLTLDSLFLAEQKALLSKGTWSQPDLLIGVSKYSDFLQKKPTSQDIAMLRSLISGPTGSSDLLDFDLAVSAFKDTPTALGAVELLQSFVLAADDKNSGFGIFDGEIPTSGSNNAGPREINVNDQTYSATVKEVVATVRTLVEEAIQAQIRPKLAASLNP